MLSLFWLRVRLLFRRPTIAAIAADALRRTGIRTTDSAVQLDLHRALARIDQWPKVPRETGPHLYPQLSIDAAGAQRLILEHNGETRKAFDPESRRIVHLGSAGQGEIRVPVADLLRQRKVMASRYKSQRRREILLAALPIVLVAILVLALLARAFHVLLSTPAPDAVAWGLGLGALVGALILSVLTLREQIYAPDSAIMSLCGASETSGCRSILHGPLSNIFGIELSELGIVGISVTTMLWLWYPPGAPEHLIATVLIAIASALLVALQIVIRQFCIICNLVHALVFLALISAAVLWSGNPAALAFGAWAQTLAIVAGTISAAAGTLSLLRWQKVWADRIDLLESTQTVSGLVSALTQSGPATIPAADPIPADIDIPARRPVDHILLVALSPTCGHCLTVLRLLSEGWLERLRDDFRVQIAFVGLNPDDAEEARALSLLKQITASKSPGESLAAAYAIGNLTHALPEVILSVLERHRDEASESESVPSLPYLQATPALQLNGRRIDSRLNSDAIDVIKLLGGRTIPV